MLFGLKYFYSRFDNTFYKIKMLLKLYQYVEVVIFSNINKYSINLNLAKEKCQERNMKWKYFIEAHTSKMKMRLQ